VVHKETNLEMSIQLIGELENLTFEAWPADVTRRLDGWRARFNGEVTRRANSVWPNADDKQLELSDKLALVEEFYAQWSCRARYQICPAAQPEDLDEVLGARGYTSDARTAVQIAPQATVLARLAPHHSFQLSIFDSFNRDWFDAYCQIEEFGKEAAVCRQGILQRIRSATGYALLKAGKQPVAVGLVVAANGWGGIFCMATHINFRRQGAAGTILHALTRWSKRRGVWQMYLQVMENNAPAQALYTRAGFETIYHYHYREAPPG
jgi:ribosomal protein S18 acetylase RimI-like enzyme